MQFVDHISDANKSLYGQIFCNLNTLSKCISNTMTTFVNDIKHSIKECFAGTDVASSLSSKKPTKEFKEPKSALRGPGKTPTLTTSQNFRSKLWAALEWLFDEEIFGYCNQVKYNSQRGLFIFSVIE